MTLEARVIFCRSGVWLDDVQTYAGLDDVVFLTDFNVSFPLAEIYSGVEFTDPQ